MIENRHDQEAFNAFDALSAYAFNKTTRVREQKENFHFLFQHAANWGVWQNKQLTSQLMSIPLTTTIFGRPMTMAGIGNVATYPENRGEGGVRHLFSALFADLRKNQVALSYLAPFSYPFYRKFGYEACFNRKKVTISAENIGKIPNEKKGRMLRIKWENQEQAALIKELHTETLAQTHGTVIREEWWWDYVHGHYPNRQFALCLDEQNRPQGYLIYECQPAAFVVYELAYKNQFAFRKLQAFISSHSGTFPEFIFYTGTDEPWLKLVTDPRAYTQSTTPYMMARIVCFDTFIANFPFIAQDKKVELTLKITDETCAWNQGIWYLTIQNGKASVQKIANEVSATYSASIQTWTALFLGYISLESAIFAEKITTKKTPRISLAALLPQATPTLYDYF